MRKLSNDNEKIRMNESRFREFVSGIIKESLENLGFKSDSDAWFVCCVGNYGDVEVWVTDDMAEVREASMTSEGSVMGPYSSYEEADYAADIEVKDGQENGFHRIDK